MFIEILKHTPTWVWVVFAALVALGLSQARAREISRTRATLLPLVFIALSLAGVVSVFGFSPIALLAWLAGFAGASTLIRNAVAVRGAEWSPVKARLSVPGSWIPLMLILGLFLVKYGIGVSLAMHDDLVSNLEFSIISSCVYGIFAGLFWARAQSLRNLGRSGSLARMT